MLLSPTDKTTSSLITRRDEDFSSPITNIAIYNGEGNVSCCVISDETGLLVVYDAKAGEVVGRLDVAGDTLNTGKGGADGGAPSPSKRPETENSNEVTKPMKIVEAYNLANKKGMNPLDLTTVVEEGKEGEGVVEIAPVLLSSLHPRNNNGLLGMWTSDYFAIISASSSLQSWPSALVDPNLAAFSPPSNNELDDDSLIQELPSVVTLPIRELPDSGVCLFQISDILQNCCIGISSALEHSDLAPVPISKKTRGGGGEGIFPDATSLSKQQRSMLTLNLFDALDQIDRHNSHLKLTAEFLATKGFNVSGLDGGGSGSGMATPHGHLTAATNNVSALSAGFGGNSPTNDGFQGSVAGGSAISGAHTANSRQSRTAQSRIGARSLATVTVYNVVTPKLGATTAGGTTSAASFVPAVPNDKMSSSWKSDPAVILSKTIGGHVAVEGGGGGGGGARERQIREVRIKKRREELLLSLK